VHRKGLIFLIIPDPRSNS